MKRVLLGILAFTGFSTGLFAQVTPELLKDINTSVIPNSDPYGFVRASSSVYFAANEEAGKGKYPFVTDGTEAGTEIISGGGFTNGLTAFAAAPFNDEIILMDYTTLYKVGRGSVTELMTGFNGKTYDKLNQYTAFQLNGKLFFWADAASTGVELYVTDGTSAGTALFKDFSPTWGSSNPGSQKCFFKYEDVVYFLAKVEGDMELWKTDGTEDGTKSMGLLLKGVTGDYVKFPFDQLVDGKIFISGADQFFDPKTETLVKLGVPSQTMENSFRLLNDKICFLALVNGPGPTRYQVYAADATGAATQVSESIVAGKFIVPRFVTTAKTDVNGKAIFIGQETDGDNNYQIWASDGTKEGTEVINSSIPKNSLVPSHLFSCGDKIYLLVKNSLWVTDGTEAGTQLALEDPNTPAPNYYMDERSGRMYLAFKETNKIGAEPYFFECGSGIASGIADQSQTESFDLVLFPNPNQGDHINIETPVTGTLEIFDIKGRLQFSQFLHSGSSNIILPGLAAGIYTIGLSNERQRTLQKLIVR